MAWTLDLYNGTTYTSITFGMYAGDPTSIARGTRQANDAALLKVGDAKAKPQPFHLRVRVQSASITELMTDVYTLLQAARNATSIRLTDGATTYTRAVTGFIGPRDVTPNQTLAAARRIIDLAFTPASPYWDNAGTDTLVSV